MFNQDFYPTPREVAKKMIHKISNLENNHILEPHAGLGHLSDAIFEEKIKENYPRQLHLIEKEQALFVSLVDKYQYTELYENGDRNCKGKGLKAYQRIKTVGRNFLEFETDYEYSAIIMNPPFSNGVKHVLKAISLAENQQPKCKIVSLLNAETINNPYTEERKKLLSLLDKYGADIDKLGQCFTSAERKTNVEVVLIALEVPKTNLNNFFEGLHSNFKKDDLGDITEDFTDNTPALNDKIGAIVQSYNLSLEALREMKMAISKFRFYSQDMASLTDYNLSNMKEEEVIEQLKEDYWNIVFQRIISSRATSTFEKNFKIMTKKYKDIAFTEENILELMDILFQTAGNQMKQAYLEVFDRLTKFDEKNYSVAKDKRYKSNSAYKLNKRMIVPYVSRQKNSNTLELRHWYNSSNNVGLLDDLDKILCNLTGENFESIDKTKKVFPVEYPITGYPLGESTFFKVRAYKKGTIHLMWKDKKIQEKFNRKIAELKGWLPQETDRKL